MGFTQLTVKSHAELCFKKNNTQKEILDFSLWHVFLKISPYVIDLNDTIESLGTGALHGVLDRVVDVVLKHV